MMMNKRIKQLADAADLYARSDNSSMFFPVYKERYTSKLSQLILNECLSIVDDEGGATRAIARIRDELGPVAEEITPDINATVVVFEKEYNGETLYESTEDIGYMFEDVPNHPTLGQIPRDEYGFQLGTFTVSVTWRQD